MQDVMETLPSPGDYHRISAHRDAVIDAMKMVNEYYDVTTSHRRAELREKIEAYGLTFKNTDRGVSIEIGDDTIQTMEETDSSSPGFRHDVSSYLDRIARELNLDRSVMALENVSDFTSPHSISNLLSRTDGEDVLKYAAKLAWVIDLKQRKINPNRVEAKYPHFYIDRYTLRRLTQQKLVGLALDKQIQIMRSYMQAPSGISTRKSEYIEFKRDRLQSKSEILNPDAPRAQRVSMNANGGISINRPLPPGALAGLIGELVEDVIEGAMFENTGIRILDTEVLNLSGGQVTVLMTDNNQNAKLVKIER